MSGWRDSPVPEPLAGRRSAFLEAFGGVYEHSRWVAEGAWDQVSSAGRYDFGMLADVMRGIVDAAGPDLQMKLLRAHPELASLPALAGELSADSASEQRGAGLHECSPEELARLHSLNAQYRERMGFPFIVAVTGLTRSDILEALRVRSASEPATEYRTALRQVHRIAEIRLEKMASFGE